MERIPQYGLAAERERLIHHLGDASSIAYDFFEEHNLERIKSESTRLDVSKNNNGLTTSVFQKSVSIDLPYSNWVRSPSSNLRRILPDVVDVNDELRATIVIDDWDKKFSREKCIVGLDRLQYGLMLESTNSSYDKVKLGIPSDFRKGLFLYSQNKGTKTDAYYRSQIGKPLDLVFLETAVFGTSWILDYIKSQNFRDFKILKFPTNIKRSA